MLQVSENRDTWSIVPSLSRIQNDRSVNFHPHQTLNMNQCELDGGGRHHYFWQLNQYINEMNMHIKPETAKRESAKTMEYSQPVSETIGIIAEMNFLQTGGTGGSHEEGDDPDPLD